MKLYLINGKGGRIMNVTFNSYKLDLKNAQHISNSRRSRHADSVSEKVQLKDSDFEKAQASMKKMPMPQGESGKIINVGLDRHFRFIQDIEELTDEEKTKIEQAILSTIQQPNGGSGDLFRMNRAQAKAQLNFIAEYILPEQYRSQMQQAIESYGQEGFEKEMKMYKDAVESVYQHTKNDSKLREYGEQLYANLSSLQADTHMYSQQESKIDGYYENLASTTASDFVKTFEKIMEQFKKDQKSLYGTKDSVLNEY